MKVEVLLHVSCPPTLLDDGKCLAIAKSISTFEPFGLNGTLESTCSSSEHARLHISEGVSHEANTTRDTKFLYDNTTRVGNRQTWGAPGHMSQRSNEPIERSKRLKLSNINIVKPRLEAWPDTYLHSTKSATYEADGESMSQKKPSACRIGAPSSDEILAPQTAEIPHNRKRPASFSFESEIPEVADSPLIRARSERKSHKLAKASGTPERRFVSCSQLQLAINALEMRIKVGVGNQFDTEQSSSLSNPLRIYNNEAEKIVAAGVLRRGIAHMERGYWKFLIYVSDPDPECYCALQTTGAPCYNSTSGPQSTHSLCIADDFFASWQSLRDALRSGALGRAHLFRETSESPHTTFPGVVAVTLRLYCWGGWAAHTYAAVRRLLRTTVMRLPAEWIGADNLTILTIPPDS